MKYLKQLFVFLFIISASHTSYGKIFFQSDFDSHSDPLSMPGWKTGSNVSLDPNGGLNFSQCVRVCYTSGGTGPYLLSHSIGNLNLSELYIRFYFKVDKPSGGAKFLKLFGKRNDPVGYANSTFGLHYYDGNLKEISYGSGSSVKNDTQTIIRYNGKHTDRNVIIQHASRPFMPVNGQWHCFEAHIKYNGNWKRDGLYEVWIDGKLRIKATNIKNRNEKNSMYFERVGLANYCHNPAFKQPWTLWYDNFIISDEYIGPIKPAINKRN